VISTFIWPKLSAFALFSAESIVYFFDFDLLSAKGMIQLNHTP
jgi:hypothetical protein